MQISEIFTSLQGEGSSLGIPSVFIRLQGCAVGCTWCDSKYTWKPGAGKDLDLIALVTQVSAKVNESKARRVIITGGEPLENPEFYALLYEVSHRLSAVSLEVETSGTIAPDFRASMVRQWNVSVKLSHSGVPYHRRIVPSALTAFVTLSRHFALTDVYWKFVTTASEQDISEICELRKNYRLHDDRILLMPLTDLYHGGSNSIEMLDAFAKKQEREQAVWKVCQQYGWRYTPRAHEIFGMKRGI